MLSWVKRSQKPKTCDLSANVKKYVTNKTDWFGEDVKNSITNNLSIHVDNMSTLGKTPDAVICQS